MAGVVVVQVCRAACGCKRCASVRELVIPAHTRVRTEPCLACGAGERTRRAGLATPSSFVGASPRQRRPRSSLHVETCSSVLVNIYYPLSMISLPDAFTLSCIDFMDGPSSPASAPTPSYVPVSRSAVPLERLRLAGPRIQKFSGNYTKRITLIIEYVVATCLIWHL